MSSHFRKLLPLLLVIFVDSFAYFVVIPVLLQLYFNNHYGLLADSASQSTRNILTGLTIALSPLAALLAAPIIGSASDKYGRKKTLLVCVMGTAFGFLLPIIGILSKSLGLILLGRFVAGVGSASQPVAQAAVADLCQGKEKAYYLNWIALVMTLALLLGPLAGGYLSDPQLVSWFTVTTPYWCAFIISLIALVLLMLFFQETSSTAIRQQMLSAREVLLGLPIAIKQYHVGILLLIFFCLELGWSQYYQAIFLYLSEAFHYTPQQVSTYASYMGILMCVGLLVLYPLLLRVLSIAHFMKLSILLVFVGLLGCAVFPTPLMQWIFIPLVVIFTGTAYVNLVTLISNKVSATHQGWVMGYTSTTLFFAWLLTAFNGGWLISLHLTLPLFIAVLALLIGSLAALYYKDKSVS